MSSAFKEILQMVNEIGKDREYLLPVLQAVSSRYHYLSRDLLADVARAMEIPSATIYGVASFYSFLDESNRGEVVIRICSTISCDLKGKSDLIEAIEKRLSISAGETTPDGKVSLLTTGCIGRCHESPAMMINEQVYTALTVESALDALEEWL